MKKYLYLFFLIMFLLLIGCSTTSTRRDVPMSMQITADIEAGEILTAELPYSNDPDWKEQLIAEALKDKNYDVLLAPRYQIIQKGLSKKMRVVGRGARLK